MTSVIKFYRFFDTETILKPLWKIPEQALTGSHSNGNVNGRSNMIFF